MVELIPPVAFSFFFEFQVFEGVDVGKQISGREISLLGVEMVVASSLRQENRILKFGDSEILIQRSLD